MMKSATIKVHPFKHKRRNLQTDDIEFQPEDKKLAMPPSFFQTIHEPEPLPYNQIKHHKKEKSPNENISLRHTRRMQDTEEDSAEDSADASPSSDADKSTDGDAPGEEDEDEYENEDASGVIEDTPESTAVPSVSMAPTYVCPFGQAYTKKYGCSDCRIGYFSNDLTDYKCLPCLLAVRPGAANCQPGIVSVIAGVSMDSAGDGDTGDSTADAAGGDINTDTDGEGGGDADADANGADAASSADNKDNNNNNNEDGEESTGDGEASDGADEDSNSRHRKVSRRANKSRKLQDEDPSDTEDADTDADADADADTTAAKDDADADTDADGDTNADGEADADSDTNDGKDDNKKAYTDTDKDADPNADPDTIDESEFYKDGVATSVLLNSPLAVTLDSTGENLYFTESSKIVRKLNLKSGQLSTIAQITAKCPLDGIAIDKANNVYVGCCHNIFLIKPGTNATVMGKSHREASLFGGSLILSPSGKYLFRATGTPFIRRVMTKPPYTSAAALLPYGDTRLGTESQSFTLALDNHGNLLEAGANCIVNRLDSKGELHTIAGYIPKEAVTAHKDGRGVDSIFPNIGSMVTDRYGNIFLTDPGFQLIRKVTTTGHVISIADTSRLIQYDEDELAAEQMLLNSGQEDGDAGTVVEDVGGTLNEDEGESETSGDETGDASDSGGEQAADSSRVRKRKNIRRLVFVDESQNESAKSNSVYNLLARAYRKLTRLLAEEEDGETEGETEAEAEGDADGGNEDQDGSSGDTDGDTNGSGDGDTEGSQEDSTDSDADNSADNSADADQDAGQNADQDAGQDAGQDALSAAAEAADALSADTQPWGIAVGHDGSVYFAVGHARGSIRKLSTGCPEGQYNRRGLACEKIPHGYYLPSQESNTIYRIPNSISAKNVSNLYAYSLLAADTIATFTFIFSGIMIIYLSTRYKTRRLAGKRYVRVKQKDDEDDCDL